MAGWPAQPRLSWRDLLFPISTTRPDRGPRAKLGDTLARYGGAQTCGARGGHGSVTRLGLCFLETSRAAVDRLGATDETYRYASTENCLTSLRMALAAAE